MACSNAPLNKSRIDERHDVTFVNARIEIGIQLGDGSGNLRSDLDGDHRVDRSGRLDHVVNLAAFHLRGEVLRLGVAVQSERDE